MVKTSKSADGLAVLAPFTKDYPIPEQGTRYYLCWGEACTQPVDSITELESLLTHKNVEHIARKHSVDYAIKRDKHCE